MKQLQPGFFFFSAQENDEFKYQRIFFRVSKYSQHSNPSPSPSAQSGIDPWLVCGREMPHQSTREVHYSIMLSSEVNVECLFAKGPWLVCGREMPHQSTRGVHYSIMLSSVVNVECLFAKGPGYKFSVVNLWRNAQ